MMNQKGLAVIVLAIVVLIGGGYYYNQSQRPYQQPEAPQSNSSLISEEESLNIAKQVVLRDLKNSVKINCLVFAGNTEANDVTYTVTRKFDNNCPGDLTLAPTIPQLKIDRQSRMVFVQSLDGEFRPPFSSQQTDSAIQNEIANWQMYKNGKYGIKLKYPSAWYATEPYSDNFQGDAICFGPTKERGDSPEFCVTLIWPRDVLECLNNLKACASNRDVRAEERIKDKTAEEKFLTINNYPAYYYKVSSRPYSAYIDIE